MNSLYIRGAHQLEVPMKYNRALVLALFLLPVVLCPAWSNSGTDFYLCFDRNYIGDPNQEANALLMQLNIVSEYNTDVHIEIASIGYKKTVTLTSNSVQSLALPSTAMIDGPGMHERAAIHVHSSYPIT